MLKVLFSFLMSLLFLVNAQAAIQRKYTKRDSEINAEKQDLMLVAGLQTVLDLNFKPCEPIADCVKVVNSQLVTIQYEPQRKQLIFTPIKSGETTISLRDENGDLKLIIKALVSNNSLARSAREIKDLLKDVEGIQIRILGNKIVVDGEIIVPSDLGRVLAVLGDAAYKEVVLNLVSVSPIGQQILAKRIQDEINNPRISVRVLNGTYVLEGVVENPTDAQRAEQILLNLMPDKIEFQLPNDAIQLKKIKKPPVLNLIRVVQRREVPDPKMIRLTLNFVELAKSYNRVFGFSWQPGLDTGGQISFGQSTTGGLTSQGTGALSGTISNLFPKLRSAQDAGYARVLQEVVLLTQDKKPGNMSRGNNIPIPVIDRNGTTSYKAVPVGLQVKVTPQMQGENIVLDLDFDFKSLAGKANQQPIVAENKYKGTVVVKSGDSAGVMNLVSNDITTDFNKDQPGQNDQSSNPLFSLLRSKAFAKSKSQFVIFVTPLVLENSSNGTDDIKRKYGVLKR